MGEAHAGTGWCRVGFRIDGLRLGLINQAHGGFVKRLQLGLAGFVAGELDHVAHGKKFAETVLLIGQQQIAGVEFMKEFLRGAFRRVEIETLLQIKPHDVRDENAKGTRLRQEREGFLKLEPGAFVRRDDGNDRRFSELLFRQNRQAK